MVPGTCSVFTDLECVTGLCCWLSLIHTSFCKSSKTCNNKDKNVHQLLERLTCIVKLSFFQLSCLFKLPLLLTWMLNSKALTASSSTPFLSSSVSSKLFMWLRYSCLNRLGLVTSGKAKNDRPSLLLSPMDFWAIRPRTCPPDRSPRYRV